MNSLLDASLVRSNSTVKVVTGAAIGPTLLMEVNVEGVKVSAVVDTGSRATIISVSQGSCKVKARQCLS